MDAENFNPLKITGITITWEIENIWNLAFEGVSSGSFVLSDHIFHLHMRRYELGIAVYLCRDDMVPASMTLLCKLSMVDQIGHEKLMGEREVVIEKGKEFALLESLMISDLEAQKAEFLNNDTLTISCSISSSYRMNILQKRQKEESEHVINRFEMLSSDLENFFKAQLNTDALLTAENVEFPVHLAVIQARSPTLASKISKEPQAKALDIPNISASILGDVLYYIYTGKIKGLTSDRAIQMLATANEFILPELKDISLKFLQANLTEENVFEVAVLAHENSDLFLKEEVEKYIVKNLTTILQSEKWKQFCSERYKFANDILTSVLLRMQIKDNVTGDI